LLTSNQPEGENMAFYESVVITRPELTETQIDNLISNLSKTINENNGKIVKKEQWGLRSFAYKIKKNKKGHYFMLSLDSASNTIFEYERQMRINEDIIRFLTIKIDEIDNKPSPLSIDGEKSTAEFDIKESHKSSDKKITEKN